MPHLVAELSFRVLDSRLKRNALFAVGQSLIVSLCVFLVYRLLIAQVGIERVGIWSLLLAGSALFRIGDVSGSGAVARFVAIDLSGNDAYRSRDTVHTVVVTTLGFNSILGLLLYFLAPLVIPRVIPFPYLAESLVLVPYVVAIMLLSALSVAIISGIDGAQRADRRALVISVSALIFLGTSWYLVPKFGVLGYAAALVVQQTAVIGIGWCTLRHYIPNLGWFPYRWNFAIFRKTTGYALKLSGIGIVSLMFEPLAKFAFNHVGGPGLVAYFELASRLVGQVRSLVIAAATPLTPAFAATEATGKLHFEEMLDKATRMASIAGVAAALVTVVGAPVMSLIVLGRLDPQLLLLTAVLTAGWSINILAVPFYFAGQGRGVLLWNFLSHTILAMSVLAGVWTTFIFSAPAILVGAVLIGLVASTTVTLVGNAYAFRVLKMLRKSIWPIFGASTAIALICTSAAIMAVILGGQHLS
jgi:O-antigen/teichoic acid export membrane protein